MYFPAFFNLEAQQVLIVGGGEVALRKLLLLERAGASITVVAPAAVGEILQRASAAKVRLESREFVPEDLDGVRLVIQSSLPSPPAARRRCSRAVCANAWKGQYLNESANWVRGCRPSGAPLASVCATLLRAADSSKRSSREAQPRA